MDGSDGKLAPERKESGLASGFFALILLGIAYWTYESLRSGALTSFLVNEEHGYLQLLGRVSDFATFAIVLLLGRMLLLWKANGAWSYGLIEILIGAFAATWGTHDGPGGWLKIASGVYIIVRGMDNFSKGKFAWGMKSEGSHPVTLESASRSQ